MMIKEARYVDDALNGPINEHQPLALKATRSKEALPSKVAQIEAAGLNDEEMALIIKRFKTVLKGHKGQPSKTKTKGKRSCFTDRSSGTWTASAFRICKNWSDYYFFLVFYEISGKNK